MSIIPATLLGSNPTSSDISLAIGPTVTIATVLFAVQISTKLTKAAIPNSAPILLLKPLNPLFIIKSIPPLYFIISIVPAIKIDIIISSLIPPIPSAIAPKNPNISKLPVANPIIPAITVPPNKTTITFNPTKAPTITAI